MKALSFATIFALATLFASIAGARVEENFSQNGKRVFHIEGGWFFVDSADATQKLGPFKTAKALREGIKLLPRESELRYRGGCVVMPFLIFESEKGEEVDILQLDEIEKLCKERGVRFIAIFGW